MKTQYHFILIIYILVFILFLIYLFTDCDDYIKVLNTGNIKIDNMPYWVCPDKNNKFSRIKKFNKGDSSMGILDKWSITHITHGMIFFTILLDINKKYSNKIIYISLFIELVWEILENLPYIINKYRRSRTIYRDYVGDSISNIVSDLIFTVFGIIIAYDLSIKPHMKPSLKPLFYVIIFFELLTYYLIDDNIIINLYSLFIENK
jgi:hypothetical protein